MVDDERLKPRGAELARVLHDTLATLTGQANALACLAAEVPGMGTVLSVVSHVDAHDIGQRLRMLEAAIGHTPDVPIERVTSALMTPEGRQHVRRLMDQVRRTDDEQHRAGVSRMSR